MRTQFSSFTPSSITSKGLYDVGIFKNVNEDGKSANVYGTEMVMELKSNVENPYFTFSYKDIPTSSCPDLLLGDWGNDPSSGLKEIKVEGTGKTSVFNGQRISVPLTKITRTPRQPSLCCRRWKKRLTPALCRRGQVSLPFRGAIISDYFFFTTGVTFSHNIMPLFASVKTKCR